MCENFVLHHAATVVVRDPEIELCLGVALVRGEAIPLCCLHVVLRYASAFLVHGTEAELGVAVSLVSHRTIKPQGGCVVGSGKRSTSILERTCRHWHTKLNTAGKSPVSAILRAITSDRS